MHSVSSKERAKFTSINSWRAPKLDIINFPVAQRWEPYRDDFQAAGYELWSLVRYPGISVGEKGQYLKRPPDQYHIAFEKRRITSVQAYNRKHFPASDKNGHWVFIQLVAVGNNRPAELNIIRYLQSQINDTANHALPVIDEIHIDNLVFAVFPQVGSIISELLLPTYAVLFHALDQVIEGFDFMHRDLIAHRDIAIDNILSSGLAPIPVPFKTECFKPSGNDPTKTNIDLLLTMRYYIIDLETAVMFSPDTPESERLVQGIPTTDQDLTLKNYARCAPPEVRLEAPYDPFAADVGQLGLMCLKMLEDSNIAKNAPRIHALFVSMAVEKPEERPKMGQVLERFREISSTFDKSLLNELV